ncbi:MAG TPA: DUF2254 domain-containing protein, partial [Polyangiaceae bacterium]|nr:DUF2254 domain-containing protein [Polyangiaceae bacterium]
MTSDAPSLRRTWILRVGVLLAISLVAFWTLYSLDFFVTGRLGDGAARTPFSNYLNFDPGSISDAISSLAGNIAAIFGLVITVVSIIVQLSADRYTGVTRMFFRDRLNMGV